MFFIRQNATHKVVIGPVVAVGDGFTPVTTLALGTADEAEAILHDNGTVVDISAYTFAAITTADGYYHLTLQSGISGTVGHLTVVINDDSLCLPVKAEFTVLEEAAYDAMYASAAPGYVVDQPVDVTKISGDATAADNAELFFDNTGFNASNSTIGTVTTATGVTLSDTTHGGASAVLNLERLVINSTTLNQPGILITGDGTGAGISTTGGASGQGILSTGGSGSGEGIKATGGVGGGTGFSAVGTVGGHGINASNTTGTGNGMNLDTSGSGAGNAFQTSVAGSNEHFTPFNTAIPGAPTADSIYERIAAIDDLTQSGGSGDLAAILTDTGTDGVVVSADGFTDIWATTTLTEAYATDGSAATPAQLMYMIWAALSEFSISGTTITAKKLDGSTTAMTFTLDDASDPTSRTRAT